MDQRFCRREFAMPESSAQGIVRIGAVVTKEIDERDLHPALTANPTGAHQSEGGVERRLITLRAGIEDRPCYLDNVGWQAVVAHRVLRYELEQTRLAKVVAPFKHHPLPNHSRMHAEMPLEAVDGAIVKEVYSPTEDRVLNPLLERTIKGAVVPLQHMRSQPRP